MKNIIEGPNSVEIRLQGNKDQLLEEVRAIEKQTWKNVRAIFSWEDWLVLAPTVKQEIFELLDHSGIQFDREQMGTREYSAEELAQREINIKQGLGNSLVRSFPKVLSGECPEILMEDRRTFSYFPELEKAISIHPDLGWVQIPRGVSIFNLKAVVWVMKKHSDIFPKEATENPLQWLRENVDFWIESGKDPLSNSRYGLLSGFDRISVEKFQIDWSAKGKIERVSAGGSPQGLRYKDLLEKKDFEGLKSFLKQMKGQHDESLTEDEIRVHLEGLRYFESGLEYVTFDEGAKARQKAEIEERITSCTISFSKEFYDLWEQIYEKITQS